MRKTFTGFVISAISLFGLLIPQSVSAQEVCIGDVCTVNFAHTGQTETWQVPTGVEAIYVELAGGQGGSSGGEGGVVKAWLTDLPQELIINVGGMGKSGPRTSGGFNGGGDSGGRYGNPGAGGGASDIRFGELLEDRVLVAGGGGGFGGPSGGAGGLGGSEFAGDGSAGQGGSGAGGTQSAGGAGGATNGDGDSGIGGSLGVGGKGGFLDSGAGGGGGGGGYFGGGGGGADRDVCCLDAGGGGGGSSFADKRYTHSVEHIQGVNEGDGSVSIRYSFSADLSRFDFTQTTSSAGVVAVDFDKDVTGLELEDFSVLGCNDRSLSGAGSRYRLALSNCEAEITVSLAEAAAFAYGDVPKQEQTLTIELDKTAPEIVIDGPDVVTSSSARFIIGTAGNIDLNYLFSSQCQTETQIANGIAVVDLSQCPEGEITFSVNRGFTTDSFGNPGPTTNQTISFTVDTLGPKLSFTESQTAVFSANGAQFSMGEVGLVSADRIDYSKIQFTGDSECLDVFSENSDGIRLMALGCPAGEISWLIPANSQSDQHGNLGPTEGMVISLSIPEVINETETQPIQSMPTISSPAPRDSEEEPAEDVVIPPVADAGSEDDEIAIDDSPTSPLSGNVETTDEAIQPAVEESVIETSDEVIFPDPAESLLVSQQESSTAAADDSAPWGRIGLASLAIFALLIGVLLLTKNYRSRSID